MVKYDVKQVILVRKDLNMRKGKIAAQVAHASMKVFLDRVPDEICQGRMVVELTDDMEAWINESFAKIVLSVESEQDLFDAIKLAQNKYIPYALITDAGNTEFHGVPTNTCLALGPAQSSLIDEISGPNGVIKTKLL